MAVKNICPICNKRPAERYCPAKGEKICAIDCGTGREVTIDCPSDCAYLVAAHRWEQSHPKPLVESDVPFPDVSFPSDLIHTRQAILSGLGYIPYSSTPPVTVRSTIWMFSTAVQAMAETWRTLLSGISLRKAAGISCSPRTLCCPRIVYRGREKAHGGASRVPRFEGHGNIPTLGFLLRFGRLLPQWECCANASVP